jgi:integrase
VASISTNKKTGLRRIIFERLDNGKQGCIRMGRTPLRTVESIRDRIEAILAAQGSRTSIDGETARWLGEIDPRLHAKLAANGLASPRIGDKQSTVGGWLAAYVALRADVKPSTATVYGHTHRCLVDFFGQAKPLADVTPGDADAWRIWLGEHEGLALNTINRRCGIAKQFFRAALRRRLITDNPFADMRNVGVRANKQREFFVTAAAAARVLDACPDIEWKLLFALSRWGGLRCPSEHLALKWGDVDWARSRIRVSSPKTEHHEGKAFRWLPIFPELRPHLEAAFHQAPDGAEWVISRYRGSNTNLRTRLERIIHRAGLEPWPKLFQNLRATRQTELAETFPSHVVCEWIGNTQAVAARHYLQVTEEHFEKAARQAAQQAPESVGKGQQSETDTVGIAAVFQHLPTYATNQVGDEGLEPPTSTV